MKKFEEHFNRKYKTDAINIIDELMIDKFIIKKGKESFEVSKDIIKNILKLDSVRQNYLYRRIGSFDSSIYPGGFNLLNDNLFKAKLFPLSVEKSFEKDKEDITGISAMSAIYAGKTVGKPKPGKSFSIGIFLADYLLAVDDEITMDMATEMEPYQLGILRLNEKIDKQTRLFAELNWE